MGEEAELDARQSSLILNFIFELHYVECWFLGLIDSEALGA
jgi:hypothetical protein